MKDKKITNLPDNSKGEALNTKYVEDKYAMDDEPRMVRTAPPAPPAPKPEPAGDSISEPVSEKKEPVPETAETAEEAPMITVLPAPEAERTEAPEPEKAETSEKKPAKKKRSSRKKKSESAKTAAPAAEGNAVHKVPRPVAFPVNDTTPDTEGILPEDSACAKVETELPPEIAALFAVPDEGEVLIDTSAGEEFVTAEELAQKPVIILPDDELPSEEEAAENAKAASEQPVEKHRKWFKRKKKDDGMGRYLEKGSTRIRYRIMKLCIMCVCIAVVITQVYSVINTAISYDSSYTDQAQSLLISYLQIIDTKLDAYTLELNGLRKNSTMTTITDPNILPGAKKSKLTELATSTMFKFIDLADTEGNTLSETNIADREYFQRALSGTNTLSSPLVRRTIQTSASDEYVMILGVKFTSATYQGVLTGGIDPTAFSAGLDSISEGNSVVVLDKDGVVVASSDMALVNAGVKYKDNEKAGLAQLADTMMSGETGVTKYTVDGVQYLAAYCPIELTNGWTIAVSLDYSKITSEIIRNVIIALIIAAVIVIVATVIGRSVAHRIAEPITQVAKRLHKLSQGDISSKFEIDAPKDETKVLTDSLSQTIEELSLYISDIRSVLAEIASGNLTARSEIEYIGDFTAIGSSLEQITESLNQSFSAVKYNVESIKSSAAQVAMGSQHLSESAIKEAEAVDEILSTIGGITEKANATAQVSTKVLTVTNEANENAQRGADKMKELLTAIENIKDKSDSISAIIKTIDSIAFQTNILSINASIEAARAGEAGRGFSVVAEEVGNLSNMSADAVKQTAELINDTIAAVNQGTEIADKAEEFIRSIAADVNEVADYMEDIVKAANEQNAAVEQITTGISRIDTGMHLTTATAEESAASSEHLSQLAVRLSENVSFFKTEE